ncbi:MAG: hypothetical protein BWY65_01168 [Firmicutes bacterium ADurb.Bin373]|nr:MAG: hypothetical protein BWY65_01168 [Firmicutes bacterium ADurb.Bin373]
MKGEGKVEKLVKVAAFLDVNEAYLAKGLLENEGIEVHLFDERSAVVVYTPFALGGLRLMVRQPDLARAASILSGRK